MRPLLGPVPGAIADDEAAGDSILRRGRDKRETRDDLFERLFDSHAASLLNFLSYQLNGDLQTAEDLVSATFERVLTARKGYNPRKGSEKTWLYTISMNILRDQQRRRAAESRAYERHENGAGADTELSLDAISDRETVMRALAVLTEDERQVVALRFGANMRNPEIAEVLGESLTTVEGRLYRALRKLRDRLERPTA